MSALVLLPQHGLQLRQLLLIFVLFAAEVYQKHIELPRKLSKIRKSLACGVQLLAVLSELPAELRAAHLVPVSGN